MGEVNEPDNAVDHGVAKSDQCVDGASGKAAEKKFYEIVHNESQKKLPGAFLLRTLQVIDNEQM